MPGGAVKAEDHFFEKPLVEGGKKTKLTLPRSTVNPRAHQMFLVIHPDTSEVATTIIEDRKTFFRDIVEVGAWQGMGRLSCPHASRPTMAKN